MTIKKLIFFAEAFCLPLAFSHAQTTVFDSLSHHNISAQSTVERMIPESKPQDKLLFSHLDAALTVGTTGIGFDLAMPINEQLYARAGFSFMPPIHYPMTFNLTVEQQANAQPGDNNITGSRFDRMADIMYQFTGQHIDPDVKMIGKPNYYNFKLLFDFYPWKDKKWFATAGFYWGNKCIAKAENDYDEFTTLFSVNMFNNMQDKVADAHADLVNFNNKVPMFEFQGAIIEMPEEIVNRVNNFGRVGFRLGDSFVTPDQNNRVTAEAHANSFKPYIGIGWGDNAVRGDKKWAFSIQLGCLFWGGAPNVYTQEEYYHQVPYQDYFSTKREYINDPTRMEVAQLIAQDKWSTLTVNVPDKRTVDLCEKNVKGHVGDYIDIAKNLKLFPVLNIRFARRIF